jgi:hypothetical protein
MELNDALRVAMTRNYPLFDIRADWDARPVWGVRMRVPQASPGEWLIHEITLFSGEYPIAGGPQWRLRAWPNVGELPLAFDQNLATRWRTWEPIRAGMYVEVDFDRAQALSGAVVTSPNAFYASAIRILRA